MKIHADGGKSTYIDSPEFLYAVKRDDLLEKFGPILTLPYTQISIYLASNCPRQKLTFPLEGFVNHSVHSCIRGCLTLKLSGSWNTVTFSSESIFVVFTFSVISSVSPSAGEIGIVSRGTGLEGSMPGGGEASVAMILRMR